MGGRGSNSPSRFLRQKLELHVGAINQPGLIITIVMLFQIHSVNELNHLPSLNALRFRENPLFQGKIYIKQIFFYYIHQVQDTMWQNWFVLSEETTFESRQELLARLPSLTSLNGSPVSCSDGPFVV